MIKYVYITIFFFLILNANAKNKENIINNLKNTKNINFDFEQNINKKIEKGNCVIEYPKKIFCEYDDADKKIIVSNGNSLVIKNRNSGIFYIYPLKKTPLGLLLDKNYLISSIAALDPRNIDDKYLVFKILKKNNTVNIFFDKKTYDLVGWQTEDIYQNLAITFISSVKVNQNIDSSIFVLPKN